MRAHRRSPIPSILVLFIATAWPVVAQAQTVAGLPNPSFEEGEGDGARGWSTRAWAGRDHARWSIASPGRTGGRCVSIASEQGSDAAWTATVDVKPQTPYRLSGWIRTKGVQHAQGACLNIQDLKDAKTAHVTGTSDWTRVSTVFRTGTATTIEVNCLFGGWGISMGQAWYDDITLEQVDEQEGQGTKGGHPARLSHCPELLFIKRHHNKGPFGIGTIYAWDSWEPGGGIYAVDPRRPGSAEREVFRSDHGVVFSLNLSYDAKRILFSWMDLAPGAQDSFHVYEIGVDGQGLRQLTRGRYHDVSATWLPNGRICFSSTRVESWAMCQPAPACALFVMEADGGGIRRIEYSTLGDYSPSVMADGSILFMRWEYNDRSIFTRQKLWTINPDGTRVRLYFGNTLADPNILWQARQVPGSDKVVCTMGPHHKNPVGAIGMINQAQGIENPAALVNLTPSIPYIPSADHADWQRGDGIFNWSYCDPWPLDAWYTLAAYGGPPPQQGGAGRYRLILLESGEQRTLVHEDPRFSCFNPIPLLPQPVPPVLAELPPSGTRTGVFVLQDVYQGLDGVPRGAVKSLRIMSQVPKPCNMRGQRAFDQDPLVGKGTYYVKYNHGTVPVEEDGSAHFLAPAGVELYFQAIDADGREICRMGSLTQIMPGEVQSCVGCHEPRGKTAAKRVTSASRRPPTPWSPPAWGAGTVDFVRQVQPVLDRYCVSCHGGTRREGDIDLSGDPTRFFNMAYDTLTTRRLVAYYWLNTTDERAFTPMTTGSQVSRLTRLLEEKHARVDVDPESRQRIYAWMDANVPYYGTYENTHPGTAGSRDLWTGPWFERVKSIGRRRGMTLDDMAINLRQPQRSRIILDHLPGGQGGRGLPPLFQGLDDPDCQALLQAIQEGRQAMEARPRMDMPGAEPVPYPRDFGNRHTGFAGP